MKSNQIILFIALFFYCLNGYGKHADSTYCIILSHTDKNQTIKFENYQNIIVWVNDAKGLQHYEGLLNIQNDSTIQINSETIAINEIIGFKKKSSRRKNVGKGFIIGGLTIAVLGGIGTYAISQAEISNFIQFFYLVIGVLITGGAVIAGVIYTIAGIAIMESAESKEYRMDTYEAQIKWVQN